MLGCGDRCRTRARGGAARGCEPLLGWRRDKTHFLVIHLATAVPAGPAVVLATSSYDGPRPGLRLESTLPHDAIDADCEDGRIPVHKLLTHFFFAARFRRLFGTGVRSSKCRDTVGVKCSDVIGASAESQPALPLLCAKGPFATLLGASFPKVRSQPVIGAHAAQARCKAHNTSFDGVDRSTGISSSIVVASVVCEARNPRNTTPAFCASRAAAQKPGSW